MNYNLFDSIETIKYAIFAEGLLSYVARCLACLFAGFILIKIYNNAMNSPYGLFNYKAVLRMFTVVFLVCNFNSFVLYPVDSIMRVLSRGITGGVQQDKASLQSQVNQLYENVEDALSSQTLYGQYNQAMDGMTSTAEESGFSYDTNSSMESSAESEVTRGEKKGFWEKTWGTVKHAVSQAVGFPVTSVTSILSWLISVLVIVARYMLTCISGIYCIVLGILGPMIFAISLIPSFESGLGQWIARYVQISLWVPVASIIDFVNFKMKDVMLDAINASSFIDKLTFPTFHIVLLDLVTFVMLLAVPSICGWIIHSSGAGEVNGSITNNATRAVRAIATKH